MISISNYISEKLQITSGTSKKHSKKVMVPKDSKELKEIIDKKISDAVESSSTVIDVSDIDTSNVKDMSYLFVDAKSSIVHIDGLDQWDVSHVTNMINMFANMEKLDSVDMSTWDTSNVDSMQSMFMNCKSLKSIDLSMLDFSNLVVTHSMFKFCTSLEEVEIGTADMPKLLTSTEMFFGCKMLKSIDLDHLSMPSLTIANAMFKNSGLESIDIDNKTTSKLQKMNEMFGDCTMLKHADLSKMDVSSVNNAGSLFSGCLSLEVVKLPLLDIYGKNRAKTDVINARYMLEKCKSLREVYNLNRLMDIPTVSAFEILAMANRNADIS